MNPATRRKLIAFLGLALLWTGAFVGAWWGWYADADAPVRVMLAVWGVVLGAFGALVVACVAMVLAVVVSALVSIWRGEA